jgi:hypothetical protein
VLALLTYSFLWLPVGWVIADPLGSARGTDRRHAWLALAELVLISLCVNLTLLRTRPRRTLACLGALGAVCRSPVGSAWFEAARAGAALLAAGALWLSYLPGTARAPRARRRSGHGRPRLRSTLGWSCPC